jgi:colanic acid biosynthesis glycosyl transferase WcaI
MSEPTMRVGILSQWFDPEPGASSLPGVLARALVARGHDVQVVTGFPNYPTGRLYDGYQMRRRVDEVVRGVPVRRVALYASHNDSLVQRSANYGSFALSALASGVRALRDVDALWVYNSPASIALPMWWSRYAQGVPTVLHIMDLWPDSILASGFARPGRAYSVVERGVHAWCNGMYRASSSVAYISPGIGPLIASRGVPEEKLHYVPVWTDEEVFRPATATLRERLGIHSDQVVLLYAGALGDQQALEPLITACSMINDPRLVCLVAGAGIAEQRLRALAESSGATNVRFIGLIPKQEMTEVMASGDVHYVGLHTGSLSKITLPSKLQATMACAKPLIVAVEGDAAKVATESGGGFAVVPGRPEELAHTIRRVLAMTHEELTTMGRAARSYYDRTFSVEIGVDRVEHLLREAASQHRR